MRVLVGCETSGIVRRAFSYAGHDAWSVDVLPAEDGSNRHIIGDVRDQLDKGWDLLAVMHPPCTRLCLSGLRWLHEPPPGKTTEAMWSELDAAAELFSACWNAPIPRIAVENPKMHRHGKERIAGYREPSQIVQPWWFGEATFKGIGLYLKGLPPLRATQALTPPAPKTAEHRQWSSIHRASGWRTASMEPRWKERSRFFPGVAQAMAEQWGPTGDPEHFELVG
jgi:hypothetical protein